jgi:hypothetical protein
VKEVCVPSSRSVSEREERRDPVEGAVGEGDLGEVGADELGSGDVLAGEPI